jgi:hypothetical protein
MSKKVLDSLEILRFRGFKHLRIEHLGGVNLIVGKNNVGKSSLLEALQLYAQRASPDAVWKILGARGEDRRPRAGRALSIGDFLAPTGRYISLEEALASARYLFYGRKEIKPPIEPIEIGPVYSVEDRLTLNIQWYDRIPDEKGGFILKKAPFEDHGISEISTLRFVVHLGRGRESHYPIEPNSPIDSYPSRLSGLEQNEITNFSIDVNGLDRREVGQLWDRIALTNQEREVLTALRIIASGVEGVSVIGDPMPYGERVTIVKVRGIDEPLPIRSLGDGMQRLLGISLALVNAKNGMLLIDEIENGLHYSVQLDLWRLIFQLARRLNVQVFATTHSWDCIEAFQHAAQEDEQVQGILIRLEMKNGEIGATLLDEQDLAIATRDQIEVR